jgi:hypothetical protein
MEKFLKNVTSQDGCRLEGCLLVFTTLRLRLSVHKSLLRFAVLNKMAAGWKVAF